MDPKKLILFSQLILKESLEHFFKFIVVTKGTYNQTLKVNRHLRPFVILLPLRDLCE